MNKVFESINISFAKISEELIDDYLIMINDYENVDKYLGGEYSTYTKEQEEAWVKCKLEENALIFSMIDKNTNKFIGNIELMNPTSDTAELGIAITANMQNKGYGKEAIKAFLDYSFQTLKLNRVFLRTRLFNLRAIHVYKMCGFKEYKRDDEHLFMEIFK